MVMQASQMTLWAVGGDEYAPAVLEELGQHFKSVMYTERCGDLKTFSSLQERAEYEAGLVINAANDLDVFLFLVSPAQDYAITAAEPDEIIKATSRQIAQLLAYSKAASRVFTQSKKSGHIVSVCDVAGVAGRHDMTTIASTSGAIIGFIKSMAKELGRYSITANVVCYGFLENAEIRTHISQAEHQLLDASGLGKPTTLRNLALSVAYLSEVGNNATGQVLRVDSGLFI